MSQSAETTANKESVGTITISVDWPISAEKRVLPRHIFASDHSVNKDLPFIDQGIALAAMTQFCTDVVWRLNSKWEYDPLITSSHSGRVHTQIKRVVERIRDTEYLNWSGSLSKPAIKVNIENDKRFSSSTDIKSMGTISIIICPPPKIGSGLIPKGSMQIKQIKNNLHSRSDLNDDEFGTVASKINEFCSEIMDIDLSDAYESLPPSHHHTLVSVLEEFLEDFRDEKDKYWSGTDSFTPPEISVELQS